MIRDIIHFETTCCCKAERMYLKTINASCFAPIGCFAYIDVDTICHNNIIIMTIMGVIPHDNLIKIYLPKDPPVKL